MFGRNELKVAKERYDNTLNYYDDVMKVVMNKTEFLYKMKSDLEKYLPIYSAFFEQFKVKEIEDDYQESIKNIDEYYNKQKEYEELINNAEENKLLDESFKEIDKNGYFGTVGATIAYTSLFGVSSLNMFNAVFCALVYNPIYDIFRYLFNPVLLIYDLIMLKKHNLKKVEEFNKACASLETLIKQHRSKLSEIDNIINMIQELLYNLNIYFLKCADYPKNYNALYIEQREELGAFVNMYKTLSEYLIKEIKLEE